VEDLVEDLAVELPLLVDQELVDKATMAAQVLEALTVVAEVVVVQVLLVAMVQQHQLLRLQAQVVTGQLGWMAAVVIFLAETLEQQAVGLAVEVLAEK
jgi:uncharacterized membrane protein